MSNKPEQSRPLAPATGSASGPKFKVGDRVSVPVRFGETGTVKELKDGRYGVTFKNLEWTLWYDENELRHQDGPGFSWLFTSTSVPVTTGGESTCSASEGFAFGYTVKKASCYMCWCSLIFPHKGNKQARKEKWA